MRYIKTFNTHSQYETYKNSAEYTKPNVSFCIDNNDVHYNYNDPRLIAKYNVTSTSSETNIMYRYSPVPSQFSEIEIDGVVQPSVIARYQFTTTGEHTVKYTLADATTILDNTFYGCGITNISIPNSVETIGATVFASTKLTNIKIPNNVTSIGGSSFQDCTGLTTVDIPNSITSIPYGLFYGCSGLTNITLPNTIASIMEHAFNTCTNLTSITILATTPPTLANTNAFMGTNNCPIYVPSASVSAYQTATNWSSLASRIQAIPS